MMNHLAADAPTMSTPMSKMFTIVCHNVVGGVRLLEKKNEGHWCPYSYQWSIIVKYIFCFFC